MKTINQRLLAAAVAAGFTVTTGVFAGDALLSPRAKDQQISAGTSMNESKLERGILAGSPRGREQAESLRKSPGSTENKLERSSVIASPKMRDVFGPSAREFQAAPVK